MFAFGEANPIFRSFSLLEKVKDGKISSNRAVVI
jgi:hypothetical protein